EEVIRRTPGAVAHAPVIGVGLRVTARVGPGVHVYLAGVGPVGDEMSHAGVHPHGRDVVAPVLHSGVIDRDILVEREVKWRTRADALGSILRHLAPSDLGIFGCTPGVKGKNLRLHSAAELGQLVAGLGLPVYDAEPAARRG